MSDARGLFDHIKHGDIDELADAIGELLQNPITIEDADHRLIAYSSHGDITDQARWSTIMGRRVPERVLTRLWKDGVFQQLLTQADPVHIPAKDEVGLGKRVAIAIRRGDEVLGYIWAQELNRPITRQDDETLRQAARAAVTRLLQRQGKRKAEEQRRKEFFWELLLGNHQSETAILQKAETLHLELQAPYLVCIIDSDKSQLEQVLYPLLMRDRIIWGKDGNQLIMLLSNGPLQPKDAKDKNGLLSYAESFWQEVSDKLYERFPDQRETFSFGYGRPCQAFMESRRSYQEAMLVLQVKRLFPKEVEKINGYHDLGIYRFLLTLKKWNNSESYQNERLRTLESYDRDNQTNLLETLETFLDTTGKVNQTAQSLHIHINTLSYRLRRIEEIMGISLDDPNQRTAIYLELKLRKLI
ncbi:PucR family transcriptional regulator [Brevibacillus dissolubilis]|uniref:PucR family transcriptional regulator n=1 Tax=Brevibacillus dissolubilis TaxID=1844116 RepID=UPI001115D8A0|nr:helix-turn-helix domain-containing protein [Brevibacillus dissolubilis]